jgi:hypothetical protein
MSDEPRVSDLLLHWEELREQGRPVPVEELCRDCPELLDELRRRVRALEALDPLLGPRPKPAAAGATLDHGASAGGAATGLEQPPPGPCRAARCRRSPAMRSCASWAAAAWASSTWPATPASIGWWR